MLPSGIIPPTLDFNENINFVRWEAELFEENLTCYQSTILAKIK